MQNWNGRKTRSSTNTHTARYDPVLYPRYQIISRAKRGKLNLKFLSLLWLSSQCVYYCSHPSVPCSTENWIIITHTVNQKLLSVLSHRQQLSYAYPCPSDATLQLMSMNMRSCLLFNRSLFFLNAVRSCSHWQLQLKTESTVHPRNPFICFALSSWQKIFCLYIVDDILISTC